MSENSGSTFGEPDVPGESGSPDEAEQRDPVVATAQLRVTLRHADGKDAGRPTLAVLEGLVASALEEELGDQYGVSVTGEWT